MNTRYEIARMWLVLGLAAAALEPQSGGDFRDKLARLLLAIEAEIAKRSDQVTGFAVLPKR